MCGFFDPVCCSSNGVQCGDGFNRLSRGSHNGSAVFQTQTLGRVGVERVKTFHLSRRACTRVVSGLS